MLNGLYLSICLSPGNKLFYNYIFFFNCLTVLTDNNNFDPLILSVKWLIINIPSLMLFQCGRNGDNAMREFWNLN